MDALSYYPSLSGAVSAIGLGFIVYSFVLVAYRLVLSPIKNFPGPKLAAITLWYEFYYDVILGGQYEWKIAELHKSYGPIVRISPFELHIDDPDFYETLYNGGERDGQRGKVNKWAWDSKKFGTIDAIFGTPGHDLHRNRRAVIAPLFSMRAVADLTPLIQAYTDRLLVALRRMRGSTTSVNLFDAFSALTGDIISDYSFGQSLALLERPDFGSGWHSLIHSFGGMGHVTKQFPWLNPLMQSLPENIALKMNPPLAEIARLDRLSKTQIAVIEERQKASRMGEPTDTSSRTIFHAILSSSLPTPEKRLQRLVSEASTIMVAGTGTTADTLAKISFFLLSNPSQLQKLRQELNSAKREDYSDNSRKWLQKLESLPYATAVLKEGLRVTGGVMNRLPRILPDTDLSYGGYIIPRGTPMSMSTWNVHKNPQIFPDPEEFRPERWLKQGGASNDRLERYLLAFSKGTRQCVGLNLAWAEMYFALATVFGCDDLHMKLFETTFADVEAVKDNFIEGYRDSSKGVRVLLS